MIHDILSGPTLAHEPLLLMIKDLLYIYQQGLGSIPGLRLAGCAFFWSGLLGPTDQRQAGQTEQGDV